MRRQEDLQVGGVHVRVRLDEGLEVVPVVVAVIHLLVLLEQHEDGGAEEHVERHDEHEQHEASVVLVQVQPRAAAAVPRHRAAPAERLAWGGGLAGRRGGRAAGRRQMRPNEVQANMLF